ncbi:hypothetical protein PIB30_102448, partial [Stylosanthes scabra]|nr:hypothetical protein [Stylosanthes scabra]
GNKDKQPLSFDPEIERTLRKLRKQAKLQEHIHDIPFEKFSEEEIVEENSEEEIQDNMADNPNNQR